MEHLLLSVRGDSSCEEYVVGLPVPCAGRWLLREPAPGPHSSAMTCAGGPPTTTPLGIMIKDLINHLIKQLAKTSQKSNLPWDKCYP